MREMIKFGLVGASSTAIDCAIMLAFRALLHRLMDDPSHLKPLIIALGFCGGATNGYFMNSRWTFRFDTKEQEKRKFAQFLAVSLVGLGLTWLIMLPLMSHGVTLIRAKACAIFIVFFWNFTANKLWTFKKHPKTVASKF